MAAPGGAPGPVSGRAAGGLVGYAWNLTIRSSYAIGKVNAPYGPHGPYGGLVGISGGGNTILNSYWNTTTSGQSTSAGGVGLTDTQMKQQASFVGFDFVNVWGIDEGKSYPFLLQH